ncbi:MAG: MATE family multidrug resistance protein, partial [Limisphaerales bacterium]
MKLFNFRDREILRLAIPNILSNLSVPLIGIADTALMGRMDSPSYLGAIALGGVLFNFIYWGFSFLRMSTVGLTAQAFGKNDKKESAQIFSQALTVALVGAVLVLLLQMPIANLGFKLLKGGEEVKTIAREYFFIRIWAAPATLALYAIQGWFLGMQNAKYPLYLTLLTNLCNVGFNIWFVFGMEMQAGGVALGTVCAQYIGLVFALFLLWKIYRATISDYFKTISFDGLGKYFSVSRDIFIRTICLLITFAIFTSESAGKGDVILAANAILLQLFYVMSYGVDGFAFAAESITGKFIGSKSKSDLVVYLKRIFSWGMV